MPMPSIFQRIGNGFRNLFRRSPDRIVKNMDEVYKDWNTRNETPQDVVQVATPVADKTPSLRTNSMSSGQLKVVNKELTRPLMRGSIYLNYYNLGEMLLAYQGEAYFKYSVDRYVESVMRNGWKIISKNPKVAEYLQKRIREIEIVSKTSFNELLRDWLHQILIYGNAFVAIERTTRNSTGQEYTRFDGKRMLPISYLRVMDARKIHIGQNMRRQLIYIKTNGVPKSTYHNPINPLLIPAEAGFGGYPPLNVSTMGSYVGLMWQGVLNSNKKNTRNRYYSIFDEDHMIHTRYHHNPGARWSMPPFWPVLMDIETLRKIESNVELLMFQYGNMLLHAKIGDDKRRGTREEIRELRQELNDMEGDGFIVTDNRVDLDAIGAEGKAIRAENYLKFFKNRVLTGLWLSETGVGESGAGRNTGDIIDDIRQDKTIELTNILQLDIQRILIELLLEAGPRVTIDWVLKPENVPDIHFPEVDMRKKIMLETHAVNMYQGNMITVDEARLMTGREPMSKSDEKKLFVNMVTIPAKKAGIVAKAEAAAKTAASKVQPTNQHGTKPGPTRSKN